MNKTDYLILIFLFLLSGVARSQHDPSIGHSSGIVPVGKYLSHTLENGTLRIQSSNGELQVLPFDPEIIRVTFIPGGTNFNDTSYSVVREPQPISVGLEDQFDYLTMTTDKLVINIGKNPITVSVVKGRDTLASEELGSYALDGGQGVRFNLGPAEMLFGGGSRALPLNRRGFYFSNYNQPHYGYSNWEPNLNISIPVIVSTEGYLLFFDNPFPGSFDLGASNSDVLDYFCESGPLSYFLIAGDDNDQLLGQYTLLTGRQPLPPLWSLGYIQSRFGYENEAHARFVVESMRSEGFPMDAIVLDLYWYGGVEDMCNMTWDLSRFPTPVDMMSDFRNTGVRTILIGETYFTQNSVHYNFLSSLDYLCTNSQGNTYVLNGFWAGPAGLLDLTRQAAFNWMWNYYDARIQEGASAWWSDLGEPEQHPDDMVHYHGTAREIHNVYSLLWAKGLYEKYAEHYPGDRLFNLIRSGYAGMQRYATFPWSGDVSKSWEGFQAQIPIMLGMGLSGVAYMGCDLGGFTGDLDEEMYTRWMQFGCFSPTMRSHGVNVVTEPVFFSPFYKAILKDYLLLRYRLLPYNYTLAWQNSQTGRPLAMPMNYFDPGNLILGNIDDQYFWGENLLVAPVMAGAQETRPVYLPEGAWIDFWTNQRFEGEGTVILFSPIEKIPVMVKAGSFIPMAIPMLSSEFYHTDTLQIWYYPDKSEPYSSFDVYQDDGVTQGTDQAGLFEIISLHGDTHDEYITITIDKEGNGYPGAPASREFIFEVKRILKGPQSVQLDGITVPAVSTMEEYQTLPAAFFWDPLAYILRVHFRWEKDASTLVISGAGLGTDNHLVSQAVFGLSPPCPNPFSDQTQLRYTVPEQGDILIRILNLQGHPVYQERIINRIPGTYDFIWKGENMQGSDVVDGIYFLQMSHSSGQQAASKLIRIGN
jgi:alpha-glucosidase (family GH31 glycosyl hydrolase)